MRTFLLSLAILAPLGCSSTSKQPDAQAGIEHKTPVALEKPSVAQKVMRHRLEEGEKVACKTEVEGSLAR